jgi:hypothetical protein
LVVDDIEGVVKEALVPRILPPSVAPYHRVVVQPDELRLTVPDPQRLPAVVPGFVGLFLTVMGVA